jgi:hypothetical protein
MNNKGQMMKPGQNLGAVILSGADRSTMDPYLSQHVEVLGE